MRNIYTECTLSNLRGNTLYLFYLSQVYRVNEEDVSSYHEGE